MITKNRQWHNEKYPALMIDDRDTLNLPDVFPYVGIRWRTYNRVTAELTLNQSDVVLLRLFQTCDFYFLSQGVAYTTGN